MTPDRTGRRYLIAIGSPECPGMGVASLKRVASDVDRVVSVFCTGRQGYQRVLADRVPLAAPAGLIRDELAAWFASQDRAASDCVIVYVAGHGGEEGKFGAHYLFTSDSNDRELNRKAIRTAELAQLFFEGAGQRPQNVLLLLDTCYAGQGGGQAAAAVSLAVGKALGGGAGFWVIASADANTEADDGAFVDALSAVLTDDAWTPGSRDEFLNPGPLKEAVNDFLAQEKQPQRAELDVVGGQDRARFIRNPGAERRRDGQPLADEAHWDPKARGVEGLSSAGWFFTGRRAALRTLVEWLNAPVSDRRARVVTGLPGSGKSAVLAWLVTAAHPETRARMDAAGVLANRAGLVPEAGSIQAAIHARGATVETAAALIAGRLGIASGGVADVLRHVREQARPVRIVVDALDESAAPAGIERELLRPLADSPLVRLILGSRRQSDTVPLASVSEVIDLDDGRYFSAEDIEEFVAARLIGSEQPALYAGPSRHEDARRIARLVARRARFSFLYARIVSRGLAMAPAAVDTRAEGWQERLQLPEDLPHAFGSDLDRFDANERTRVEDLLTPLAYSRGKGLPQKNLWKTLASAISGRPYQNSDLRDLKEKAGYYIVADTEEGEVVYRLFHEAFAEYLRHRTREEEVDAAIARALMGLATPEGAAAPDLGRIEDRYTRFYLAAHAAAAGMLDGLIASPAFLLSTAPEHLLPHLHEVRTGEGLRIAQAYRQASHWMRAGDRDTRISYLLLTAMQRHADEAVRRLRALERKAAWDPVWMFWFSGVPSEVLAQAAGPITAVTAGTLPSGEPVVVYAAGGRIAVWDLVMGRELGASEAFDGSVAYVATIAAEGGNWIAAAWRDGAIRVFELPSCRLHREVERAHGDNRIDACAAVSSPDGTAGMVSAGRDLALRYWKVPSLEPGAVLEKAHEAIIQWLLPLPSGGSRLIASGSDTWYGGHQTEPSMVRLSTLPDLRQGKVVCKRDGGVARAAAVVPSGNRDLLAVWFWGPDEVHLIDPNTCEVLARTHLSFAPLEALDWNRTRLLIGHRAASFYAVEVQEAPEAEGHGRVALEGQGYAPVDVRGHVWSHAVRVGRRAVLASGSDQEIRLWDLDELLEAQRDAWHNANSMVMRGLGFDFVHPFTAVVAAGDRDGAIIAADSNQRIGKYGWLPGAGGWEKLLKDASVVALARVDIDGVPAVAAGDSLGTIRVLSIESGTELKEPIKAGEGIETLLVLESDGEPICFAAVNLAPSGSPGRYQVRLWNLRTRAEVRPPFELSISGWRDKTLGALATDCRPGSPVLYGGGAEGEVRAWDWKTGRRPVALETGAPGYVTSLATGNLNSEPVLIGGHGTGDIYIWSVGSGQVVRRLPQAHKGKVTRVVMPDWPGRVAAISAGSDGLVRLWGADMGELFSIDVEESISDLALLPNRQIAIAAHRGLAVFGLA